MAAEDDAIEGDALEDDALIELAPVTLASFEAACTALGLNPDAVRLGEEAVVMQSGTEQALLEAVIVEGAVPEGYERQAARLVGEAFFKAAFGHIERAAQQAKTYAERCGVWRLGGQADRVSLARLLSRFEASDYRTLYELPLDQAMRYLMLRSVDHMSEHIDEYLA